MDFVRFSLLQNSFWGEDGPTIIASLFDLIMIERKSLLKYATISKRVLPVKSLAGQHDLQQKVSIMDIKDLIPAAFLFGYGATWIGLTPLVG